MKREPRIRPGEIGVGWQARAYLDDKQVQSARQWEGALGFLGNKRLETDLKSKAASGNILRDKDRHALMMRLKRDAELPWLAEVAAHALIDIRDRVGAAWWRMFAMLACAKAEGWSKQKRRQLCRQPRLKCKGGDRVSIHCVNQATTIGADFATLPKLGLVRISGGELPEARLLSVRLIPDGERWIKRPAPMPETGRTVGVDFGVSTLATAFDGTGFKEVPAPRSLRKALKRMRRLQRGMARRQKAPNRLCCASCRRA